MGHFGMFHRLQLWNHAQVWRHGCPDGPDTWEMVGQNLGSPAFVVVVYPDFDLDPNAGVAW